VDALTKVPHGHHRAPIIHQWEHNCETRQPSLVPLREHYHFPRLHPQLSCYALEFIHSFLTIVAISLSAFSRVGHHWAPITHQWEHNCETRQPSFPTSSNNKRRLAGVNYLTAVWAWSGHDFRMNICTSKDNITRRQLVCYGQQQYWAKYGRNGL
jgi:hypothetical protein